MTKINIKFYGTRGSIATPRKDTIFYGGNTSCLEIRYKNELIICDAGTGIYPLACDLLKRRGPIRGTIIFSHYHWDHIYGLYMFTPIYDKKNSFTIIGRSGLKKALSNLLMPPNLPIKLSEFKARLKFKTFQNKSFKIGKILVEAFDLNHPNGSSGYLFTFPNGKKVLYATDNSPIQSNVELIMKSLGVDLLITDAQFTVKEFLLKKKFGHSTPQHVLDVARISRPKKIALFHHDPSHSDKAIKKIEKETQRLAKRIGVKSVIFAAREGLTIRL